MIGFIGLGNMGGPMAANLVKAGWAVTGYDPAPVALEQAQASGVGPAASLAEAVRGAETVVTMLPSGGHLLSVYREIVAAARPDALLVDCSTVDVASCLEAYGMAGSRGLACVDAPVSGGVSGAAAATLTFMVGGDDAAVERARPTLEAMGRRVVACGPAGAGQAAKTCNNMVLGITMIALAEAFTLGERLNLSHQALFDVLSTSSGQCWALTNHCPVPGPVPASSANHGFKPGFAAALMLKDLRLAQDAASSAGVDAALGREAARLYERFVERDADGLDYAAIIALVRDRSTAT
jgi:3-hydroxyisobutyrate dehydrogenase